MSISVFENPTDMILTYEIVNGIYDKMVTRNILSHYSLIPEALLYRYLIVAAVTTLGNTKEIGNRLRSLLALPVIYCYVMNSLPVSDRSA